MKRIRTKAAKRLFTLVCSLVVCGGFAGLSLEPLHAWADDPTNSQQTEERSQGQSQEQSWEQAAGQAESQSEGQADRADAGADDYQANVPEENGLRLINANGNKVNVNQLPDSSFLYDTTITELAEADSYHNNQQVQVHGEAVGDRINDEFNFGQCWITLQDDGENIPASVAVIMTSDQADLIDTFGDYSKRGSEVQVRGIFNLDCEKHQGMTDIHATEVTILNPGSSLDHPLDQAILWGSVLAIGLGFLFLITYNLLRERQR